ncbi:MAG TPA: hypothetical protein DCM45_01760 [Clostridiales bacterium]|nr:hypothetical protein [Clostridiales bacterium]
MKVKQLSLFLIIMIIFGVCTQITSAANYSFSDVSVNTGQNWTLVTIEEDAVPIDMFQYYDITRYKYKGTYSNFTSVKPVSANYMHYYSYTDLKASQVVQDTYTVTTSVSGSNKASTFGAELGFEYSRQSSLSVESTIYPYFPTGEYYFGVKFRLRDFKVREFSEHWLFVPFHWEIISTGNYYDYATRVDYTGSGSSPVYYAWYADN